MNVLVNGPLKPAFVATQLEHLESASHTGANSFFLGRVRADAFQESQVTGIEYSAYESMAAKVAQDLENDAKAQFDIQKVTIFHSTGLVKVGEVSLLVIVSSAHRQPSFEALKWVVDTLKVKFPAWKTEMMADGSTRWIGEPGSG